MSNNRIPNVVFRSISTIKKKKKERQTEKQLTEDGGDETDRDIVTYEGKPQAKAIFPAC